MYIINQMKNQMTESNGVFFSYLESFQIDSVCISQIDSRDAQLIKQLVFSLFSRTFHFISHLETFSNSKQGNLMPKGKVFTG